MQLYVVNNVPYLFQFRTKEDLVSDVNGWFLDNNISDIGNYSYSSNREG